VRSAEKDAHERLVKLAGDKLVRPAPLTVREQMILNARLEVGDLPTKGASDGTVGWGVGIGATVGTFMLPGVGTVVGGVVGGFLANFFGEEQPDYVAAYSEKARERWAIDALSVMGLLQSEFEARVREIRWQMEQRLELARPQATPAELSCREALQDALAGCEAELRHA
jgi:hypothetical protein